MNELVSLLFQYSTAKPYETSQFSTAKPPLPYSPSKTINFHPTPSSFQVCKIEIHVLKNSALLEKFHLLCSQ